MPDETLLNSYNQLFDENKELRLRLAEAEETLNAIRNGEVDAIVVSGKDGDKIFSLTSAETPYRIFVEEMNEGATTLSANGTILYCNNRFVELIAMPSEKIIGSNFSRFVEEIDRPNFEKLLNEGLKFKTSGEIRCLTNDNHFIFFHLSFSPLPPDLLGDTCIMAADISKLKLKEEELYQANLTLEQRVIERTKALNDTLEELKKSNEELTLSKENAEESNRLKSAFLANMSHEIRTPMNGILGFAELLKEPELSGEQQQNYIDIIEKSGVRMLNIINDIVSISKIESGIMDIHLSETNVNNQVEFAYNILKLDADRKNLTLSFTMALPDEEAIIKTDSEKLYSILINLVKNAIKFTDKGSIKFGYRKADDLFEFFIKDTGIGIPKDKQEAIFERFVQVDIEDKMARQGAGLGLAITRAYVEMLGGKIWIESEPNCGSIFYFTIPYNSKPRVNPIEQNNGPNQENKTQFKLYKILIVDDDETSETLLKEMVSKLCKEVLTARNGLEAVNLCQQNPDIDLILMDIQMPVMNGYKATQQIRKFNRDVIIIAQTAFALAGDKEKAVETGCNDYISKPISREKLIEIINNHLKYK